MSSPSTSRNDLSTSTKTTSTTTVRTTSTTKKYGRSKKGSICSNDYGKHFAKLPRTSFPDVCCEDANEKSDTRDVDEFTESCLREHYNYNVTNSKDKVFVLCSLIVASQEQQPYEINDKLYRYDTHSGDTNQTLFPDDELSSFIKVLRFFFGGLSIHDELRRR